MNGPFPRQAARWLVAKNPAVTAVKDAGGKVEAMFLAALGRKPTAAEKRLSLDLIAKGPADERWVDLAHGLLMTNEFTFVD
jgi:hypothetical protein